MPDKVEIITLIVCFLLVSGLIVGSYIEFPDVYNTGLTQDSNGNLEVILQDQTTRPFAIRLSNVDPLLETLRLNTTPGNSTIVSSTAATFSAGDTIGMFADGDNPRFYIGEIVSKAAINASYDSLIMDSPLDSVFYGYHDAGNIQFIFELIEQMNVAGSITSPVIYRISNDFGNVHNGTAIDITRLIFHITDNVAMDDSNFGGMSALTNGILVRKAFANGTYWNLFNVKTNGEFGELAYDKTYDDKAPAGVYGMTVRLTYGGQSKHGVAIRLEPGERLEALVQDDLTDLSSFIINAEGHLTN